MEGGHRAREEEARASCMTRGRGGSPDAAPARALYARLLVPEGSQHRRGVDVRLVSRHLATDEGPDVDARNVERPPGRCGCTARMTNRYYAVTGRKDIVHVEARVEVLDELSEEVLGLRDPPVMPSPREQVGLVDLDLRREGGEDRRRISPSVGVVDTEDQVDIVSWHGSSCWDEGAAGSIAPPHEG